MSDIFKIVLTSALTILGGLIIFLFSQIVSKFFIDPIHEQKKTIGEIADALIYYANVYTSRGSSDQKKISEAHEELRQLATLLRSKTQQIPRYDFFTGIGIVKHVENINSASKDLIWLSNVLWEKDVDKYPVTPEDKAKNIATMLDIFID